MKKSLISFMLLLGFISFAACSIVGNPWCFTWPNNSNTVCYGWPFNTDPHTYAIALGDLDHDGDLDAYLANGKNEGGVKDTVWFNDGRGNFARSFTQSFEMEKPFVTLGDLDGDGDLDAYTSDRGFGDTWINQGGAQIGQVGTFQLWLNDGNGRFVEK